LLAENPAASPSPCSLPGSIIRKEWLASWRLIKGHHIAFSGCHSGPGLAFQARWTPESVPFETRPSGQFRGHLYTIADPAAPEWSDSRSDHQGNTIDHVNAPAAFRPAKRPNVAELLSEEAL